MILSSGFTQQVNFFAPLLFLKNERILLKNEQLIPQKRANPPQKWAHLAQKRALPLPQISADSPRMERKPAEPSGFTWKQADSLGNERFCLIFSESARYWADFLLSLYFPSFYTVYYTLSIIPSPSVVVYGTVETPNERISKVKREIIMFFQGFTYV